MQDNKFFEDKGYIIKEQFFNSNEVITNCFNEILDTNDQVVETITDASMSSKFDQKTFAIESGNLKYLAHANIYFKSINRLITSSIQNYAKNLLGEDVYLDAVELHQKLPGASLTPPHQDNFYFCLENGKSLTAYIPLNPQSEENGGLAVLPESHLVDFPHYKSNVVGFSSGIEESHLDQYKPSGYVLNPGDISFHHCNIVHLAPPNNSNKPRVNIALRFKSVEDKISKEKHDRYLKFVNQSTRVSD
jgi:ectoine hydroxylase-related dioxygenase (phytanoyl-CoA dioxygenase family)